ncbi:TetR/AcrR family transcriptional regulator [Nakamurella sp. GG22]
MNARGERTRTALIRATVEVVADVGYARATTRAIADAAGVAEGTIYRHYPDKRHLFFAAVFDRNAAVLEWVSGLPARAGTGTVRGNLRDALMKLGQLRADLLPLELWLRSDPELADGLSAAFAGLTASAGQDVATDRPPSALPGPPQFIAGYLAAEQAIGRLRSTMDPDDVAVLLLVVLFGIAMMPAGDAHTVDGRPIDVAVATIMDGIGTGD